MLLTKAHKYHKKHSTFTLIIICFLAFFIFCEHSSAESASSSIDKLPEVEIVAQFQQLRPGYVAMSSDGRTFLSVSPFSNPVTKVVELFPHGDTRAYPTPQYASGENSLIQSTIGIKMDSEDRLWILDITLKRFIIWNTKTFALYKIIDVPANALVSNSFLQDFVLDEKRNRIIIADPTRGAGPRLPAFIVMNMTTGKSVRMAQDTEYLRSEKINGSPLNPIAIDPTGYWVYFGALHGKSIYRAPAKSFASEAELLKSIELYAPKPYCDGIAVDENQNVYITNIEDNTIGVAKHGTYKDIAKLPKGQSWPDGLFIQGDYVYGVANQLNRSAALNNGKDMTKPPFLVIRTKIMP